VIKVRQQRHDCAHHPSPQEVWPIRILAGAIQEGLPRRDLLLAPDQTLVIEGTAFPVCSLVNTVTIVQLALDEVTYWYIETESSSPPFAEGLAIGGRILDETESLAAGGSALVTVWRQLLARAAEMGQLTTDDPGLHLASAGGRSEADVNGLRFTFALLAGNTPVRLVSRSVVPAHILPGSSETRRLGVAVTEIRVDGKVISLSDDRLGEGWYGNEGALRWTNGDAALRLDGAARLEVTIDPPIRYWRTPSDSGEIASRLVSNTILAGRVDELDARLASLEIAIQDAYSQRYFDLLPAALGGTSDLPESASGDPVPGDSRP
jgi:hypothetical protein